MSFNVLAIRTGSEAGDGALYPVLSDPSEQVLVELDSYDGSDTKTFVATGVKVLQVGETLKTLIRLRDVQIEVLVTEARLALACEKYDKGGGWVGFGVGGFVVAQAANAVSKARAAKRSRGKVLVGHVRYPWVIAVGATTKSSFRTEEAIRLEIAEKERGVTVRKLVELTLPRSMNATLVAQDIARRVAACRLTSSGELAPAERAALTAVSQGPALLAPAPRKFAYYRMPTFFYANARTAFPRTSAGADATGTDVVGVSTTDAAGPDADLADADVTGADVAAAEPPALAGAASRAQPPASAAPGSAAAIGLAPLFCTRCGTRNLVGDNFCKACGSQLKSPVS